MLNHRWLRLMMTASTAAGSQSKVSSRCAVCHQAGGTVEAQACTCRGGKLLACTAVDCLHSPAFGAPRMCRHDSLQTAGVVTCSLARLICDARRIEGPL